MRAPRRYIPGISAHVFQRGHNRLPIFHKTADYKYFLTLVRQASAECGVDVHAYAVMNNHYHLIATPQHERALPQAMQTIDGEYTRYYNREHCRSGTAWNARYRSKLIEDEAYWLTCLRYIEQNPVNAQIVRSAELYEWTSYRVHAMGGFNDWLTPHPVYLQLGDTPADRQRAYRLLCEVSDTVVDLPRCLTPRLP